MFFKNKQTNKKWGQEIFHKSCLMPKKLINKTASHLVCVFPEKKKGGARVNKNYHKMRQSLGSNQALLHKGDTGYPRTSKTEHTVAL